MTASVRQECERRISRLQSVMKHQFIDAFLVTHNVDIYYFTGSMQTGYLFIPQREQPLFFVKRSVARAMQESCISVHPLGSFREFNATLLTHLPAVRSLFNTEGNSRSAVIATEYDVLPVQHFERIRAVFAANIKWIDGSALLRELRMVKSPWEVERIVTVARAAHHVIERAAAYVRPGMMELELMAHIEYVFRMQGHIGLMRIRGYNQELVTGMVASGAAAAEPTYFDGPAGGRGLTPASPQGASRKIIAVNEPILIDIGCCMDGYVIDQTRTLVIGKLDEDLQQAYDVSEAILQATEQRLKPGTVCETLYADALVMAQNYGLNEYFMGFGDDQARFLGHGIGMKIDEWPVLAHGFNQPLQAGMVLAIEPKFTFPGRGVVGIENTYLITETGYEILTQLSQGENRLESL